MDILEKDVNILSKHKIMDYSLLLAVEKNQIRADKSNNRAGTHNADVSDIAEEEEMTKSKTIKGRLSNISEGNSFSQVTPKFVGSRHR